MNKINTELRKKFLEICREKPGKHIGPVYKSSNRSIFVSTFNGETVNLWFYNTVLASYCKLTGELTLYSISYTSRQTPRSIQNSITPFGYCVFLKHYIPYITTPYETQEFRNDITIPNYLKLM